MADPTQYVFAHKEIAEILVQKQGLHEGFWTLGFQLGMGNTIAPSPMGGDPVPAVIVSILSVALTKADKDGPMTIDAAKVNPPHKKSS
jgi:hypothetical protein